MPGTAIAKQVNAAASRRLVPLSTVIEVTYRCNLRCYYCYQSHRRPTGELTADEWGVVLRRLARAGTLYCTFTGGEPFARTDFLDILGQARRLGFAVSIISNGTLIRGTTVRAISGWSVMDVGISFLAADPQLHDRLTRMAGSFRRALDAVRRLRDAGIRVMIKHTVSSRNFGQYHALEALAGREGCLFESDSLILPEIGRAASSFSLSEDQQSTFLRDMGIEPAPACNSRELNYRLRCDAGRSVCGVTPSGELVPCILLPLSFGNLHRVCFNRVWHSAAARRFRCSESRLVEPCRTCEVRYYCSRCYGIAYRETGQWRTGSPALCSRARAVRNLRGGPGPSRRSAD